MLRSLSYEIFVAMTLVTHGASICADGNVCTPEPAIGDILMQRSLSPKIARDDEGKDLGLLDLHEESEDGDARGLLSRRTSAEDAVPFVEGERLKYTDFKGNNRKTYVHVFGNGGPVLIYYHGSGGFSFEKEKKQWNKKNRYEEVNDGNFILLTPDGYGDDMVENLLNVSETKSNADASNPVFYGNSFGCANLLNFMTSSVDTRFKLFFCTVAQLDAGQKYNLKNAENLLTERTFWSFVGTLDTTVPMEGGRRRGSNKYLSIEDSSQFLSDLYCENQHDDFTWEENSEHWVDGQLGHTSCYDGHVMWWQLDATHAEVAQYDCVYAKLTELVNHGTELELYHAQGVSTITTTVPSTTTSTTTYPSTGHAIWKLSDSDVRCFQGQQTSMDSEKECQDKATQSQHTFYEYSPISLKCATGAACDDRTSVGSNKEWKIFELKPTPWILFASDMRCFQGAQTGVDSEEECQAKADASEFYEYSPVNKKCAMGSDCALETATSVGPGNQWKIYKVF